MKEIVKNNLGEEIKYYRQQAMMSQKQLAKEIGTTQPSVSRWEKNEVEPSLIFCIALANCFGITLDELLN